MKLQKRTREFARVARDLKGKGLTNKKIAEEMNALGMVKKNGSAVTEFNVAHYLKGRMKRNYSRKKSAPQPAPEKSAKPVDDQFELIELVVAAKISNDKKIRAIKQLLQ